MMRRIRQGDDVVIIAGKDKGKQGKVTKMVGDDRLMVEGINLVKRHTKPNPATGAQGGIIEQEMSLHISNIALYNQATGKADKVGFKILEDGKKVRYFKSNNEVVDV